MASTHDLRLANLFSLDGYVCLITGGGTGFGLMAAQALSANGAKVYITGRRLGALEQAAKQYSPDPKLTSTGQIIPIGPCDVMNKVSLENLAQDMQSREKYLSLVVAVAGLCGPEAPPEGETAAEIQETLWNQETPEAWNLTYNSNVSSVFFPTIVMRPLLEAAPKAHCASAIGMMRHTHQAYFKFRAAKAATAHLSRMMSPEFAPSSVRVNSIAPGYFPSARTMGKPDEPQEATIPKWAKVKPAGRSGRDEELAMAIIFLAKCGHVNGEILKVDGGAMNEVDGSWGITA